jgi:hypothetical protein
MTLNPLHAAHIGRVAVTLSFTMPGEDAAAVGRALDLPGDVDGERWMIRSVPSVESNDLNDHLRFLLAHTLPHRERLHDVTEGGEVYADVLWESSYLYAGTGPVLAPDVIQGLGQLGATLGFDIYQLSE